MEGNPVCASNPNLRQDLVLALPNLRQLDGVDLDVESDSDADDLSTSEDGEDNSEVCGGIYDGLEAGLFLESRVLVALYAVRIKLSF